MIRIEPAIIVEGRYDLNKVKQLFDTLVIETCGFQIFSDREKGLLISRLAQTRGLLILTDSDAAGFQIRNRVRQLARGGKVWNAYIPDLYGKEKRKSHPSGEGKLGVEGVPDHVLLAAVERSGVQGVPVEHRTARDITRGDLYVLGLSGRAGSAALRTAVLRLLELPERMSSTAFYDAVALLYTRDELARVVAEAGGIVPQSL